MSVNGKKFKKELVQADGSIRTFEYEPASGTKTINQQLTENMDETLEEWALEAQEVYIGNYEDNLSDKKGHYAKYVVSDKKGNKKLRNGGLIMKVDTKYVMLKNPVNNLAWSVQYATLYKIFVWGMKHRREGEAPPQLRRVQRQVREEIQERKEEEENIEREQKEAEDAEEEANRPPPVPPKPRKLTDEEANELLKKAYYDSDMKFGRDKLYATMKAQGHRISRKQVDDWLKKQLLYQLDKTAFAPKDFIVQTAKKPNNVWNIDLLEIDGNKVVLNCVDRFSKFAYSRLLRNKTAQQVVNALKSIFRQAVPKTIISDNGVEFKSVVTQEFLRSKDIKQFFSTPYLPQSNGLVERFNRNMLDQFKKMTYQASDAKTVFNQTVLNRLMKAYNNSVHSIIEMSPTDALKEDNWEKVRKLNEKRLSVGVKKTQADDLAKGDEVRISLNKGNDKKTQKFRTKWSEDLYEVVKIFRFRNHVKPIQYKVANVETGEKPPGSFKREELQRIGAVENADKVDVPYEIEKFVKEEGDEIEVSYRGYRADGNRFIDKTILKNDLGTEVYNRLYAEMRR